MSGEYIPVPGFDFENYDSLTEAAAAKIPMLEREIKMLEQRRVNPESDKDFYRIENSLWFYREELANCRKICA